MRIDQEKLKTAVAQLSKLAESAWFQPPEAEPDLQRQGARLLNEIAGALGLNGSAPTERPMAAPFVNHPPGPPLDRNG